MGLVLIREHMYEICDAGICWVEWGLTFSCIELKASTKHKKRNENHGVTFYLTYILAFYLTSILAAYLTYILTWYLAFLLTFYLAVYLACYLAFYLAF